MRRECQNSGRSKSQNSAIFVSSLMTEDDSKYDEEMVKFFLPLDEDCISVIMAFLSFDDIKKLDLSILNHSLRISFLAFCKDIAQETFTQRTFLSTKCITYFAKRGLRQIDLLKLSIVIPCVGERSNDFNMTPSEFLGSIPFSLLPFIRQDTIIKSNQKTDAVNNLHLCCLSNDTLSGKILLMQGADPFQAIKTAIPIEYQLNPCPYNCFHLCVFSKDISFFKMMYTYCMRRETSLNCGYRITHTRVDKKQTILHLLCNYGHYELLKFICDNIPLERETLSADQYINAKAIGDVTPLRAAVYHGHVDIMRLLLKNGADVNICDLRGMSSLEVAIWTQHYDCANELIRLSIELDIDLNLESRDSLEKTAIFLAISKNRHELVEQMLDMPTRKRDGEWIFRSSRCDAQDVYGNTPLHVAAKLGHFRVLRLMLSRMSFRAQEHIDNEEEIFDQEEAKAKICEVVVNHDGTFSYNRRYLLYGCKNGKGQTVYDILCEENKEGLLDGEEIGEEEEDGADEAEHVPLQCKY